MGNNLTPAEVAICDLCYTYDAPITSARELAEVPARRLMDGLKPTQVADARRQLGDLSALEPEPEKPAPKKRGRKKAPLDDES
tara:strand:+ start:1437 stop:1685 length:249 start_codon:yes stop_codon:yes gene_type:complete